MGTFEGGVPIMVVRRGLAVSSSVISSKELHWLARANLDCPWRKLFCYRKYRRLSKQVASFPDCRLCYQEIFRAEAEAWRQEEQRQRAVFTD